MFEGLGTQKGNPSSEIIVWCCVAAAVPLADLALQCEEMLRNRAKSPRRGRVAARAEAASAGFA